MRWGEGLARAAAAFARGTLASAMQVAPSKPAGSRLRVLHVGPLYVNHLRRWAEHAAALGCTVSAAGHVRPKRRPIELTDVADHVEIAPEGLWELGTARRVAWLMSVLRRLQPDLLHAHWLPTWGYFATLSGHRPLVVTPWGSDLYLARGAERKRADRALRSADGVLARSPHMLRNILARGASAERIHRVDLGVDLGRFRPASPGEQARARHELDLPAGPIILSFRAGTPLYNLDTVLEAFRMLRARLPDATLLMLHGGAPLSRPLRASLHGLDESDGIRLVGDLPHANMRWYLTAATAGVSIPSSDGSPSSVWEALACGLPVVLSDLPQMEERLGESEAVRLVEPRPETVASALYDVLAHPRLQDGMARAARAWAVENADEREQVARLGRVYATMQRGSVARQEAPSGVRQPPATSATRAAAPS
ncbi:MAG: glycosyltransferase [Solirubrobacterales bacterium]